MDEILRAKAKFSDIRAAKCRRRQPTLLQHEDGSDGGRKAGLGFSPRQDSIERLLHGWQRLTSFSSACFYESRALTQVHRFQLRALRARCTSGRAHSKTKRAASRWLPSAVTSWAWTFPASITTGTASIPSSSSNAPPRRRKPCKGCGYLPFLRKKLETATIWYCGWIAIKKAKIYVSKWVASGYHSDANMFLFYFICRSWLL